MSTRLLFILAAIALLVLQLRAEPARARVLWSARSLNRRMGSAGCGG